MVGGGWSESSETQWPLRSAGKTLAKLLAQKYCLESEGWFVIVFSSSYLRDSSINILHSRSHYSPPSLWRVIHVLGKRLFKGPISFDFVL